MFSCPSISVFFYICWYFFYDSILAPLLGYFIHLLILVVAIEIILCILIPLQSAFKYLFPLLIICTVVMFYFCICYKHHNTLLRFLLHTINSLLKWLQCWENLFYISHIFIISDVLCRSKVSSDIIFFCIKYFFSYFFECLLTTNSSLTGSNQSFAKDLEDLSTDLQSPLFLCMQIPPLQTVASWPSWPLI